MLELLLGRRVSYDQCLDWMEKWSPLYYEVEFHAKFHEALVFTVGEVHGESSSDYTAIIYSLGGVETVLRPKSFRECIMKILCGDNSKWLNDIKENIEIPSFLRRAAELSAPKHVIHPSRIAVQWIVDMGHYSDYKRSPPMYAQQIIMPDKSRGNMTVQSATAALMAVAVWYNHESYKEMVDDYIKETYSQLRSTIQGSGNHPIGKEIKSYIVDPQCQLTAYQKIFVDALFFFRSLHVRHEEQLDIGTQKLKDGCITFDTEMNMNITLDLWTRIAGGMHPDVKCSNKAVFVPHAFASRIQKFGFPWLLAQQKCTLPVLIYPMIARSYIEAIYLSDPIGIELVARSITSMVCENYPPPVIPPDVAPYIGMLHVIVQKISRNLWIYCIEPYCKRQDMVIHTIGKGEKERIMGFDLEATNIYTALVAFLDPVRPHMILSSVVQMVYEIFIKDITLQNKYYHQHVLVQQLFVLKECPNDEWSIFSDFILIPQRMNDVPMPPCVLLYTLLLGRDVLDDEQATKLFFGIKLKPRTQRPEDNDGTETPQQMPPRFGDLKRLYALDRHLAYEQIPVYDKVHHQPSDMTPLVNMLACIEILNYYQCHTASEIGYAQKRFNRISELQKPATFDSYRGCVRIHDVLPHIDPHLVAENLYQASCVNAWQGKFMPVSKTAGKHRSGTQSPIYYMHPKLLEVLVKEPLTFVGDVHN